MYPYNDFCGELYHYGMPRRSGRYPYGSGDDPYQRITRGKLSNRKKKVLIKKAKKEQSKAKTSETKETPLREKSLSEMSDDEVRTMISRLQLEKQYTDLVKSMEPKKEVQVQQSQKNNSKQNEKGKSFISDVLYDSGKKAATTVLTAGMVYAGGMALNKMVGKNIVNTKTYDDNDKKK